MTQDERWNMLRSNHGNMDLRKCGFVKGRCEHLPFVVILGLCVMVWGKNSYKKGKEDR
jgi:hypothetical protein